MLDEEEKRQKINWLQQVLDVAKQLTIEGIKAVWRGDVAPPGAKNTNRPYFVFSFLIFKISHP